MHIQTNPIQSSQSEQRESGGKKPHNTATQQSNQDKNPPQKSDNPKDVEMAEAMPSRSRRLFPQV